MGPGVLRLPPELRCRYGGNGRQGNARDASSARVSKHPWPGERHAEDYRRSAGQVDVEFDDGFGSSQALQPVQITIAIYALRAFQEVRQVVWPNRQGLWQGLW